MHSLKAEQLAIPLLQCEQDGVRCPMSSGGQLCQPAARAIIQAAIEADPTYEPDNRLSLAVEANILKDNMKFGAAAKAAGEMACKHNQNIYNQTAAESPMSSIYS